MILNNKQIIEHDLVTDKNELLIFDWLNQFENVVFVYDDDRFDITTQYIKTYDVSVCRVEIFDGFDFYNYLNKKIINEIKTSLKRHIEGVKMNGNVLVIRLQYGGGLFYRTSPNYHEVIVENLPFPPSFHVIMKFREYNEVKSEWVSKQNKKAKI